MAKRKRDNGGPDPVLVECTKRGYHNDQPRHPGDTFYISGDLLIDPVTGKFTETVAAFSDNWMKKVEDAGAGVAKGPRGKARTAHDNGETKALSKAAQGKNRSRKDVKEAAKREAREKAEAAAAEEDLSGDDDNKGEGSGGRRSDQPTI